MAEVPRFYEADLAPDAKAVVYSISMGSVPTNQYTSELLLQPLDAQGLPIGAPRVLERAVGLERPWRFSPQWCPDSHCLLYMATVPEVATSTATPRARRLMRYEIATGRLATLPLRDDGPATGERSRPRLTEVPSGARWSPRGRFLAFSASLGQDQKLDPRAGVLATPQQFGHPGTSNVRRALFIVEAATGAVTQLTSHTLHVLGFDWSPDEKALVISASPDPDGLPWQRADLFIVDRVSRTVRALVTQLGRDESPSWSPDGAWIAFRSQFGESEYLLAGGLPALVPAAGGSVVRLGGRDVPTIGGEVFWQPDSRSFVYVSDHQLVHQLVTATVATRSVRPIANDTADSYGQVSFSADRKWCAFVRDSLTTPPDLFVQAWPGGTPQRITRRTENFPLTPRVRQDRVSWPSRDGLFTVHGMLLTPIDAWHGVGSDRRIVSPLPTLVFNAGGPAMANAGFARDGLNGGLLPLAARGYAVLLPNTRGRGGYGLDFLRGIRTGGSVFRLPAEDALAGLDLLVKRGIADSDRLGVFGHSYGTGLTAYIITQTARFRAAVLHEVGTIELLVSAHGTNPDSDWHLLRRDVGGRGDADPFDAEERSRLIAESPILNMNRVRTPTLMQMGSGNFRGVSDMLLAGFHRARVPSELRIYDEPHVFNRPAAIADDLTRIADWFDYWIRDLPYPDAERQREYDQWKKSAHSSRQ